MKNIIKKIRELSAVYYYGDIKGNKNLPPDLTLINLGLDSNINDLLQKIILINNVIVYDTSLDDVFYASLNKFNFPSFLMLDLQKMVLRNFTCRGIFKRYDLKRDQFL